MVWLQKIKRAIIKARLNHHKIPQSLWRDLESDMPLLARYHPHQKNELRIIASRILRQKRISAAKGFQLTPKIQATIATQIAILIYGLVEPDKNLSFDWLDNWHQIIVYPSAFRTHKNPIVPIQGGLLGVEIHADIIEEGETFAQGPIIINWTDDAPHPLRKQANQVMMHELAHKIDMLNGSVNGYPPLHRNMNAQDWYHAFETAYQQLSQSIARGHHSPINPYAATNPAEFFAVTTEYFFESPKTLNKAFPKVYHQLSLFYNQDFIG